MWDSSEVATCRAGSFTFALSIMLHEVASLCIGYDEASFRCSNDITIA